MEITRFNAKPELLEGTRKFRGTLPGGQRVELQSTDYGFNIIGDGTMAGYRSGRFDHGDTLQLADGMLIRAVKENG